MRVQVAPPYFTWPNCTKLFIQHLFIKITKQKLKSHQIHCIYWCEKRHLDNTSTVAAYMSTHAHIWRCKAPSR